MNRVVRVAKTHGVVAVVVAVVTTRAHLISMKW
jgi:hypothetical protein